ncbi:unnamed protein product, partial [Rangifer tarandus platyrhynchus]
MDTRRPARPTIRAHCGHFNACLCSAPPNGLAGTVRSTSPVMDALPGHVRSLSP